MKRVWIVGAVVALLAAVGGLAMIKSRQKQPEQNEQQPAAGESMAPPQAAEIVAAKEISWQPTADLVGTVFALRSITVRNELAGVVRHVGFQSGDAVEAGHVLLKQDETAERADLEAVKAAVRVAEANIAQADSQIKLAEVELGRFESVQSRAVAAVEVDRAKTKLESARADRGKWVAEVDQAKARVAQVEARLAKLTIKAPFRARAGMRNIHEGQYLGEGTDVVALQELTDKIYLDFAIPQEYAPRVAVGTTVMATAQLLGADPVKITVVAVDAVVNYDTRNLRVRAEVDNSRGVLVPGMSVQVRVPLEAPKKLVAVPSTAVRRSAYGNAIFVMTPDAPGGGPPVMTAHQKFVTLGQTIGEDVIVLDGLKAGEQVAAAGSFKLHEGAKVMVGPPGGAPRGPGAPGGPGAPSGGGEAPKAAGK